MRAFIWIGALAASLAFAGCGDETVDVGAPDSEPSSMEGGDQQTSGGATSGGATSGVTSSGATSSGVTTGETTGGETTEPVESAFYGFTVDSLEGEPISMEQYRGRKVLVVNVASHCGYTYQYEALQDLHEAHGDKVHVLGFPSNDFGGQEPGSDEEIRAFCDGEYGVTFDMFTKIIVMRARTQHPLYQWLTTEEGNGWNNEAPSWNFYKYLLDEEGQLIAVFPSTVEPMDEALLEAINAEP